MAKATYLVKYNLDDGIEAHSLLGFKTSPVVSLFKLYHSNGHEFRCWSCGLKADAFLVRECTDGREEFLLVNDAQGGHMPFTRDHIVPASFNGPNQAKNYRPACQYCNNRRANKMTWDEVRFAQNEFGLLKLSNEEIAYLVHIVPCHMYRGKKSPFVRKLHKTWQEAYATIAEHIPQKEFIYE